MQWSPETSGQSMWLWVGMVVAFALVPAAGFAQDDGRPTIQNRFASKTETVYAHAMTTTQVRNDYYDSIGIGIDAGYYLNESIGLEGRWAYLFSSLSPAASDIRQETGLTPDARPQHMLATLGMRYSFGYGKALLAEDFVVHFDPQLTFHGGIALAEKRVLPSTTFAFSLLTHFTNGIQAKLDLAMALQVEGRDRGWIPSIGFMPTLGFGWGGGLGELANLFAFGGDATGEGGE